MKLNSIKKKKTVQHNDKTNISSNITLDNNNKPDINVQIQDSKVFNIQIDELTIISNENNGRINEYSIQEVDELTTISNGKANEYSVEDKECSDEYVYMLATYPKNDGKYEDAIFNLDAMYKIPKNRPVRIYCDGIYDLFHYGHARQLFQAKNLFPNVFLMVGICNDTLTYRLKGITVMKDVERYESAKHCRYVDDVIEDAPWVLDDEFLKKHKIDFVAHDDIPYVGVGMDDVYSNLKKKGKFVPTKRTIGISTTSIITRLISYYDVFLRKQILRGIPNSELNISVFKEKKVKIAKRLENELEEIKMNWKRKKGKISRGFACVKEVFIGLQNSIIENQEKIKLNIDEIKNKLIIILRWWERTYNKCFKAFLNRFQPAINVFWFEAIVIIISVILSIQR